MAALVSRSMLVLPDFSTADELLARSTPMFPVDLQDRAGQLISRIRPATYSDERRTCVTDYIKSLITDCFSGFEVRETRDGRVLVLRTWRIAGAVFPAPVA